MREFALPDFPWDSLAEDKALAAAHPGGIVDLSVGTPVDPVPAVVRAALAGPAADEPGYPTTHGTPALREALAGALTQALRGGRRPGGGAADDRLQGAGGLAAHAARARRGRHRRDPRARLPDLRGGRPAGRGAVRAGRRHHRARARAARAGLAQLAVQPDRQGAAARAPAQGRGVGARSAARSSRPTSATSSLAGDTEPVSILHPDVCGGSHEGLLAVHSLSKSSNLAGLPGGLRGGRPGAGGRAAGGPQARGHDRAVPGAGGDDGGGVRRRARRRPDRAVRRAGGRCCGPRWRRRASPSSTPRPGCTCGPPRASRAG